MAKYEKQLTGDFDEFLDHLEQRIIQGSASASFEDGSDWEMGQVRIAVRVYERYSMMGGNRVSLSVTLVGEGDRLFLSAIASGGSQAMFFKVNTLGEENFLDQLIVAVDSHLTGA